MSDTTIKIEGMSCQHCVMTVKKAVDGLGGVSSSEVGIGSAKVQFDDTALSVKDIEAAISKTGFKVKN